MVRVVVSVDIGFERDNVVVGDYLVLDAMFEDKDAMEEPVSLGAVQGELYFNPSRPESHQRPSRILNSPMVVMIAGRRWKVNNITLIIHLYQVVSLS